MAILELVEYRVNFFWSIGGVTVSTLILYFFWVAVLGSGFAKSDYTTVSIGLYFLIITLVGQITHFNFGTVSQPIGDGYISAELTKPYNFLLKTLMISLDDRILKSLVITIVAIFLIDSSGLKLPLGQMPYFLLSLALASICKFYIGMIVGSLAFWFNRVHAFNALFWNIGGLFSGELIPPEFLPPVLLTISHYLPFAYLSYVPSRFLLHSVGAGEAVTGFIVQLLWICLIFTIYKLIWAKGIRRLESIGG